MRIIAFDPSLTGFGWAVLDCDEDGNNETIVDMGCLKTTAKMLYVLRYKYLQEQVDNILTKYGEADLLGLEIPPLLESYSAGLYALHIAVMAVVVKHRQRCLHINPSTVKSMAKGILNYDGKIEKVEIVKTARKLFPELEKFKRLNHNIADALFMAHMTKRFHLFQSGRISLEDLTIKEAQSYYHGEPLKGGLLKNRELQDLKAHGLIKKENDQWYAFNESKYDEVLGPKPQRSSGITAPSESSPARADTKSE